MPYSYQLDLGAEYEATASTQTLQFTGLKAGRHSLRLFSACGEKIFNFFIENTNTTDLSFEVFPKDVTAYCDVAENGELGLVLGGGVGPYEYSFDGVAWAIFTKDTIFEDIPEGTYHIRVRDINLCYYEVNDISVKIQKAPSAGFASINASEHPSACGAKDGSITLK